MKRALILPALIPLFFLSCEKEELPIDPKPDSGYITSIQEIGSNYSDQIFYDLNTNTAILVQPKDLFDLKLNCSDTNDHILLNSAIAMGSTFIPNADFNTAINVNDHLFYPDHPSGDQDSLTLGKWWNNNGLYVIHRGYTVSGIPKGYFKLKLTKVGNDVRVITSELDGSNLDSVDLVKDNTYNFVGFDFDSYAQVVIEPAKESWDLLFSQYTHIFEDSITYLVTGVLLNPRKSRAAILQGDFDEANLQDAISHNLLWKEDVLGYDWKWYNYDAQLFEIVPNQYLILSQTGTYFKLRFTDFYNQQGEKGSFNFEYYPL